MNIRRLWFALTIGLLVSASAAPAFAAMSEFEAILSGSNELPPNSSPATGRMRLRIDELENKLSLHLEFAGLTGDSTEFDFHGPTDVPGQGARHGITSVSWPGKFPVSFRLGIVDEEVDMVANPIFLDSFITANGGTQPAPQLPLSKACTPERCTSTSIPPLIPMAKSAASSQRFPNRPRLSWAS